MSQREDLLVAARKLLAEKGFHQTTARDIAHESGAHLGSIGYHYGSKDALMTAAALEAQGAWGDAVDAAVETADADNPADRLAICVDTLLEAIAAQRQILVASLQAYAQAGFSDEIRTATARATREARGNLAAMVLGRDPADVDAGTAGGLGAVVHALAVGLSFQAFLDPDSLPSGEQVARAIRMLSDE